MSNNFFDWGTSPNRLVRFDTARANDVNGALDDVTVGFDSVQTKTNAAVKLPDGETATALGNAAARKGKVLTFNSSTGQPEAVIASVDVATVASISGQVSTVAGISSNVTTVASNNTNVTTVATNIGNVNSVGSNIANVNSVATNATNINAVNANKTNIDTVAGNNANVTTVAGVSGNVTTVATNIASVNSVASNTTNINAVAGNATNINTVAGASTNVTTVAGSISNVNSCATNMAAIVDAPNQAAAAAASASAAASSYDAFDDRYLGSKAADPATDNDGNALITGAMYWNTGANEMRVWSGSAWIATYVPSGSYVAGPASAVSGNVALFDGATGKLIKDSGLSPSSLSPVIANPVVKTTTKTVSFGAAVGQAGKSVILDTDREMLLFGEGANIHAIVYNKTTDTMGSPALVRTGGTSYFFEALKSATDQVLVVSCSSGSTAFEAVVLSISGTTITVNTAATATLSAALVGWQSNNQFFAQVGTSFVVGYLKSGTLTGFIRALTISGTTVTIGGETTTAATTNVNYVGVWPISSSVVLILAANSTTLYAIPYTVSGTTLTVGTQATTAVTANNPLKIFGTLSSGRLAIGFLNTTPYGGIVSVSGTTATISAVNLGGSSWTSGNHLIVGNQVIIGHTNCNYFNVLTDNAGTAVAGTAVATGNSGYAMPATSNSMLFIAAVPYRVTISGNEPVLTLEHGNYSISGLQQIIGYTRDFGYGIITSSFFTATKHAGNPSYSLPLTQVWDNGTWKYCISQMPSTSNSPIRSSDAVKWYYNTAFQSAVVLSRFELQ